MNTAKLIEGMIPDELRLASHPDAALVNEALATMVSAMNESASMTLSGQRADVRKALKAYYEGTFTKHISEEDELWNKTKEERDSALASLESAPKAVSLASFEKRESDDADYPEAYDFTAHDGRFAVQTYGDVLASATDPKGKFRATYRTEGLSRFHGNGTNPLAAIQAAVMASGAVLIGGIPRGNPE